MDRQMVAIGCLILFLVAQGCLTPEEQARYARAQQAQREAAHRAYVQGLTNQCMGYGYQQSSPGMSQCRMQLDQQNRQNQEAKRQRSKAQARKSLSCLAASGGLADQRYFSCMAQ